MEICFEGAYAYAQLQAGAFPTAAKCPPTQEPVLFLRQRSVRLRKSRYRRRCFLERRFRP
jgi:hypothetical protein